MSETLPVAVIGAGPVGLAAAAHLLERGESPIIFETGAEVGANIRQWQHVRMFSPWEFTVDSASVRLLKQHGWQMPPAQDLPTGQDLLELYLQPLAVLPEMRDHLHLNARVAAVSRRNIDKMKDAGRDTAPFVLHVVYADGREEMVEARAVIDASGTWHKPNPLGSGGLPALGETRQQDHIFYGIPDVRGAQQARYAGKRVMVVGSGHSALNALLDLAQLKQTHREMAIYWVMRGTNLQRVYGSADDGLPARGQLGNRMKTYVQSGTVQIVSPFRITTLTAAPDGVDVSGETSSGVQTIRVDEIIAATGARPDVDMLRELRLELDPALESARKLGPMIDPNIHSCGTVRPHGEAELHHPEKDFYIAGMKSYGRAPTFLLATGYEQVRSVVAALVGDWVAAREVHLNLPETGVCSTDLAEDGAACCGTAATSTQPALLSIGTIPIIQNGTLQAVALQPIALKTAARDCGCDDDCCADGVRSTSCGCGTDCCS